MLGSILGNGFRSRGVKVSKIIAKGRLRKSIMIKAALHKCHEKFSAQNTSVQPTLSYQLGGQ